MTYYLVYKLTNLVNGKIYIGCHITKNVDDGYMGSGRRIGYAKKKYGVESFKKEILKTYDTAEEMLAEEARLVNEEFLGRDDVYNLACGGKGSWFYVNQNMTAEQRTNAGKVGAFSKFTFEQRSNTSKLHQTSWRYAWDKDKVKMELIARRSIKLATIAATSQISKEKRKATLQKIAHQQGQKNSQFGTCWIFNEILKISKKININDKSNYLKDGWKLGRKIKF